MNSWENAIANWQVALAIFVIMDILLIGGMLWQGIGFDVKKGNRRKFFVWSISVVNIISLVCSISVMLWYQP
ncbi:hypothetical protein D3C84_933150 [compost metagenome]